MKEQQDTSPRRKSETRKRVRQVLVRLTPGEAATIQAQAAQAGMTMASYMRTAGLVGHDPALLKQLVSEPAQTREILAMMLGSLGHVGSNINQIARRLNLGEEENFQVIQDALSHNIYVQNKLLDFLDGYQRQLEA